MPRTRFFEHRSQIPTSAEKVMQFHAAPDALVRLTMPPTRIQVLHDKRTSLTDGEITFNLWLGPIPVKWVARHEPGPTQFSFTDRLVRGPMEFWVHQHIFEPVDGGTEVIDRITLMHKSTLVGWLTRVLFDGLALRILFMYRHWRTRRAVL